MVVLKNCWEYPIYVKFSHITPSEDNRKPKGFLVFLEGIKWEHWPEMNYIFKQWIL